VELFETTLDGKATQLTKTAASSLSLSPRALPDGKRLVYGSKRDGVRNIYVMTLANRSEEADHQLKAGQGAMWPHWQRTDSPYQKVVLGKLTISLRLVWRHVGTLQRFMIPISTKVLAPVNILRSLCSGS